MNKNAATTQETFEEKVRQHAIDNLTGREGTQGGDLHNALFNEDYFVIGHYTARQYLNLYGVFEAIDKVVQYEKDNFGETTTEIVDEKICNMLAYILGEELLSQCPTVRAKWNEELTEEDIKAIEAEIEDANI